MNPEARSEPLLHDCWQRIPPQMILFCLEVPKKIEQRISIKVVWTITNFHIYIWITYYIER